ncbi:MAG: DEAD/DEAH box helicase, partial [Desulfamplus sp.]|nr:DEAD/DEAH box helicase [Desulfamplus sp.]
MLFDYPPLLKLPNTFRAFYGAFPSLHSSQLETIDPILEGRDIILQSATGSGKSEAVLAPCMERTIQSGRKFSILYIIPTRALAVDLKRRFEPVICTRLGLNLAIRTGDVKLTGGKRPDMMFTTPESLDVMLGSSNEGLKAFLFRVGCVIIDEVHPLIYNYRGVHLAHLLTRLERRTGSTIQRIAMSATIARVEDVINAFNFKPIPDTCHIQANVNRQILARLIHLKNEPVEFPQFINDLHDTWGYRKILLFANSRGACDRLFGIINRTGRFKGVSELHYSNLKPKERKFAEKRFRKNSHALCIATSTLELGIDVGDVDAVVLYEPPDSVSAFLQRIGRSNRREKSLNVWGICQGEQASRQVVRFLALLKLARQGIVESVPRRTLPSVMAQQIISCLYEKKQISLPSIVDLFQNRKTDLCETVASSETAPHSQKSNLSETELADLFESLEKKRWLKKSLVHGLYSGGYQYGKHLTEYKIWGNFPEAEEEYILELITNSSSGRKYLAESHSDTSRSIADIPRSIVNQIETGDRVHIAGRRLNIVKIDHDEHKRVFATSTTSKPDKEIIWIGMGAHVSFEVAQMMRDILKNPAAKDEPALLSRTTTLLDAEIQKEKSIVLLDNGIELLSGSKTVYLYRTYIGSVGNLVLELCIRNHMAQQQEKSVEVSSNETGVECSHLIKFEKLNLPTSKKSFKKWAGSTLKIIGNLIPLNIFCKTLPNDLLIEELTDFLFDQRFIDVFNHYLEHTSEIVSGNIHINSISNDSKNNNSRKNSDRNNNNTNNNNINNNNI